VLVKIASFDAVEGADDLGGRVASGGARSRGRSR
jgi:hypothetical protein